MRAIELVAVAILASGCGPPANSAVKGAGAVETSSALSEPANEDDENARAALDAFLEASRVTSIGTVPDSLVSCDPEGLSERRFALANFRVLESRVRHDTASVSAEVVSVAEEHGHPHDAARYVMVQRISVDTLHWTLLRRVASRWGVCYYSREGVDFIRPGTLDEKTEWTPAGSSWSAVIALADSVRGSGAHGSP
jgi:hypothetical protein